MRRFQRSGFNRKAANRRYFKGVETVEELLAKHQADRKEGAHDGRFVKSSKSA